jgi:hypothetical protein
MTNNHPGNEWFRRLVRSNRALYRSCPKHTKLLVAKAIVQAVQQQDPPGRFVERATDQKKKDSTESNFVWHQIGYKKAVDKTSQALRERDHHSQSSTNNKGNPYYSTDEESQYQQQHPRIPKLSEGDVQQAVQMAEGVRKSRNPTPQALTPLTRAALKSAGLTASTTTTTNTSTRQQSGNKAAVASSSSSSPMHQQSSVMKDETRKRKAMDSSNFVKPSWWNRGTPLTTVHSDSLFPHGISPLVLVARQQQQEERNKRMKMMTATTKTTTTTTTTTNVEDEDDTNTPLPLPTTALESRQSSLFRFLGSSGIFGGLVSGSRNSFLQQQLQHQQPHQRQSMGSLLGLDNTVNMAKGGTSSCIMPGMLGFTRGNNLEQKQQQQPYSTAMAMATARDTMMMMKMMRRDTTTEPGAMMGRMVIQQQKLGNDTSGLEEGLEPLPLVDDASIEPITQSTGETADQISNHHVSVTNETKNENHINDEDQGNDTEDNSANVTLPPAKGLTSQVSDWLSSFFPTNKDSLGDDDYEPDLGKHSPTPAGMAAALPPGDSLLSRSVSSSIFGLIESPSILLTSLKNGISNVFGTNHAMDMIPPAAPAAVSTTQPTTLLFGQSTTMDGSGKMAALLGEPSAEKGDSLLDDYEETPMEMKLRNVRSL